MTDGTNEQGRLIATRRQKRGLSQREFAEMIGRSEAWLSQVERGVRSIDRVSILGRIAGALGIPMAELSPGTTDVESVGVPSAAAELRSVLSTSYVMAAILGKDRELPLPDTTERAARCWTLAHAARYEDLADLLRGLLPDLERATRSTKGGARKTYLAELASVYHALSAALSKLGQHEAAWVATDRALLVSEQVGDPLLVAAGTFRLALVFQGGRQFDQVISAASSSAAALEPEVSASNPAAASLFGALNLQLAVASARMGDDQGAHRYLGVAREAAQLLGANRNDYETEFGPTNVQLHEVAVAVELGDAGSALRAAERIDPSGLSVERQARLLIDVARAWTQRRRVSEAVDALEQAEALTPEQVKGHPIVETTVSDLVRMDPTPSDRLTALARRVGVA
ncbi:helix-turn-helix domain-containing protein [Micromonospora hortensis]|uniref:helix-turn-helix domain-containing protein n=1 Tax=Micromonospora hortensis TaxID=2911209 RepID=UPI001EE78E87|nr:helix-turn-helix domain-containing protein [Micromonospora hortensis]MCG5452937.1 helix-turn-helix domain-containing protein [Micromonospora hortensis]